MDFMNAQILSKVGQFAARSKKFDLQIGMSIPGIADQATGNIVYVPYFQWSNWDIASQIIKQTGLPVIIDNDANAVALAELWFGAEVIRRTRNFIMVMVAEGIGTGIIIDGQVYRGEFGAAGEFGHMFVGVDAPVNCSCGRRDCWEAYASEKAIIRRYAVRSRSPAPLLDVEHLLELAKNGEKKAVATIKETANYLGIGISNLIIGLSPQAIVISGSIVEAWSLIKNEIAEYALRSIRHELATTMIVPSELGDKPTILGSVSLVLAQKFASAN